jgi:hypothetical protein
MRDSSLRGRAAQETGPGKFAATALRMTRASFFDGEKLGFGPRMGKRSYRLKLQASSGETYRLPGSQEN